LADKNFKREHNVMVREVMEKIFNWFLEDQIRVGNLPERKYRVNAVPPKMISVDPLKEIKAEIEKIGAGLSTLRDSAHADGKEWDEIMDQRQTEIMLAAKIASNIVNSTGEDYSSRDILGTNVKFKPEIFQDPNEQPVANQSSE
jgi:capsid protein